MHDFIHNIISQQHIPGLAIGIQQGDSVLHEGYYGKANIEHDVPVTESTVFEIASVTKLFTAQTILRLIQDGKIRFEDTIASYIDGLPEAWKGVTIQHILAHQSGIPNYTSIDRYWELTRHAKSFTQILDLVRDLPMNFPPGKRHSYDNTGYYLLGKLIEVVEKRSYAEVLHGLIFDPLQMTQTQANDYARIIPHRAQGYVQREGVMHNKDFYDMSNTYSAGNVVSTVRDLLKWKRSLYDNTILNEDYRRLWWTPHPSEEANERQSGFNTGLGWFMVESKLGVFLGHNGGVAGFASSFIHFREVNVTGIALCNGSHIQEPHKILLDVIEAMKLL
jgi:D-alanyl-D-alanine carboxypeptidase